MSAVDASSYQTRSRLTEKPASQLLSMCAEEDAGLQWRGHLPFCNQKKKKKDFMHSAHNRITLSKTFELHCRNKQALVERERELQD